MKRILCSLLVAALPFGSVLAQSDNRTVVADRHARYFGTELREESLVPAAKREPARQVLKLGSDGRTHLASQL